MSKEKIRKVVVDNQKKLLAILVILIAILLIVGISVNANKNDDYAVEIKDNGEKNIATNEDYDASSPKVYDSSVTKKIVADTPQSLTYEVQVKNLAPNIAAEVAIVIDSSRSMGINDIDNKVKEKVIQLVTELKANSPKTKISISTNSGVKLGQITWQGNATQQQQQYTNIINNINSVTFSDGESVAKGIDYATSTFSAGDAGKYLVIFSDATDSLKEKLEGLKTDRKIEAISILTDITNNEYQTSTLMGTNQMISQTDDFSNVYYKTNTSMTEVKLTDIFSTEVNEYFDFEEISKDNNLEIEKTSTGYILKCNEIKAGETKTYKFTLKLKDNANIDAGKIYRELSSNDNLVIEYKDRDEQNHTYQMKNTPTFVICKKYSLTIKAVSEKSDSLPVTDLDIQVVGTTVVGQDEFGIDIVKEVFNDILKTDSRGRIVIDDLKTLGDIKFEIKPIVNQFGYQETSATQIIVHNDPTGVGTIWAESDVTNPEVDVVARNITVLLPISVETFDMEIITTDANDENILLGNTEYRLIQPKLNSKYNMEAIYGTSDSEGKLVLKPAIMTKDGSYQYILSQMSAQEGYDSMGNVTLIVTFENGKVTSIVRKYNDLVTTDHVVQDSNKTVVRVGNVCQSADSFELEINLKDKDTSDPLFGGIYNIEVNRTTSGGEQVTSKLNGYVTDANGKINIQIPGTGYINLKITEKSPKVGYVEDKEVKDITFFRNNGTVQYISNKTPVTLDANADSDNNKIIINLTSQLANEQNRIQVQLADSEEINAYIPGVLLGINKVGDENVIQGITNQDGIAGFIVPNEDPGEYTYEIRLIGSLPGGYLAPNSLLGTMKVKYNNDRYIFEGAKVSTTAAYMEVTFEQSIEQNFKYDTAKAEIRLAVDPAYAYKFKIALVDDASTPLAGAKYSIQMESDGVEVKYLSGKLTDNNGNYTTRIVGGGENITIRVTETATVQGYILTKETQVIELELQNNQYVITNSSPNVYDPANGEYRGTEQVGKEIVYHDMNKCKTGANTILNLHINKMDQNDFLVSGVKVKLSSPTLKDANGNNLDFVYDVTDENGNQIQKDYYVTDQNGYFEILGIKVQGDKLNNGERIDYLYMNELDAEGNVIPNTDITIKITFRQNKNTNVVEVTNVEATWGNRLVKSRTFSSRETEVAYESDVYLDLFTNFDDVGNFSLDLKKVNKEGKALLSSKYDIVLIRPDGTTLVRRDVNVNDNVELDGALVSKGTKIEITEKEAPIGYDINKYTEVLTITDVDPLTNLATCELEPSLYATPRAKMLEPEILVSSDGTQKVCITLELTDYETDTFKFGITAKDSALESPVPGYEFTVSTTEGAQKNFAPTNAQGEVSEQIGANYKIDGYEVTYTVKTYKEANFYKKLSTPIEVKVIFDLNGMVKGADTILANQNQPGYGTIWSIIAANTVNGNDIDIEIKVDPCDPLTVNIKTQDTITNKELTNIEYRIEPSINLPATGTTKIKVGYVLPGGVQTYKIKQTNTNTVGNYKEIPEQQIKITYDEEGNVIALDELTNEVHEVSINGKEVSILIDAEPAVPFTMKNIAYFHNETNIVNSKFEISVEDDRTKELLTDSLGEDEKYSGKFEAGTSKIYTIKQTNAGTGYAKINDFQIEVFFDENKNITDAKIVGADTTPKAEGNVNEFVEFVTVSVTRPSTENDRGYNGNDKGIVNITVKSYPQVEFNIENVDRRDETIKLAGTVYKVESHLRNSGEVYSRDERITTGNDGIGTAKLDKSGFRNNVIYTITELQPSARYQTLGIEPVIDVEFNELGYIINATINKRDDVLEITRPEISTPEDNFKLNIKIKSNPELKVNITKVDEEDESILIPGVNFELTARILKDNLSSEEQEKLTLNTSEQTEEYYLSEVLDRLQITREEVEAIKKNIGIANIIEELKNNGNLSTEEEEEINLQLNDNLKINKIVELGKLTKTQINQKIAQVNNRTTINRLIQENKTTEDTVNDLLNAVKKQVRLDVDRVVTDQNGNATIYMDKTLANKTIEYTLKETKKASGYDWLDYVVIFEVTYDANGMMVSDNPIRKVSGNMDITSFNQYNFEISATVKNTPSKEFQIHLSVEDVYDSNKKLETAIFDAYLVDTQNTITYAPDNEYRVTLETGSVTQGTNLTTAHGEDTEVVGLYDKGAGRRLLRLVQKQAPDKYYLGTDKFDSAYQSIQYALLIDVEFNDEGNIVAVNIHNPGRDSNQIGYIADGRYLQVSHTKNTINVTVRYYPMLQVKMQAKDMYTNESLQGNFTVDTRMWSTGTTPSSAIVSAGYINPYYTSIYGYVNYGRTYNANYVTQNNISSVEQAKRVAVAPTEADSFAENKNPNKDNRVRRLYVYENAEPNAPIQYQTYLPRHITTSSQYLLAIIDVTYDNLGQVENVKVVQENSQMNITSGFFKTVKAAANEHTIEITVDYAPITTINTTVIDEVSGTGLSGIRVNPYLGGTNVTNTSYEYRTTMYYTTNSQGKTGWTYWGASKPDTLNRYILDTYTTGSGYEGYFDPNNIILDVSYDTNGRISAVTSKNTDRFGDDNTVDISWVNNNIQVTIKYARKFNVKLNKVDFYDSNKKLNAAFSVVTSEGTNASMAANTVTTIGKVYAGKTVKYTLSETAVPTGYIPIENMEIMVDFNNNGSIRAANSTSEYFEFVKSSPVDLGTNSLKKIDLEANIKNKPRFDVTIELSDKFYPSLKLAGGAFEITNSKGDVASGGIQTDANGILQTYIGTVYPNEDVLYTIKQTNTIAGYRQNTSIVTFNVHFNSNGKIENYSLIGGTDVATMHPTRYVGTKEVKLDITNIPKDVRLGIYKHDKLDNSAMSDVRFTLTTKEEGKLDSEKTVVTNANGTAVDVVDEFKQTTGGNRVVTYVISEIEAAPSYRKIQPVEIRVTYKSDGTMYLYDVISNPSNVIVEVATNKQIKYVDNTPVHIKLTIPNDNAYDLIVKNEDKNYEGLGIFGTKYNVTINGVVQNPITTDTNGIAKIMNQTQNGEITIGISESQIGEGYRQDNNNVTTIKVNKGTEIYSLEFVDNSNPTYATVEVNEEYGTITVTFKNETKLELTMQKNDINTGAVLEGAEFEILEEELDNTGAVVEGTQRVITTSANNVTDVNGLLYFDLGLSKQNKTVRYTFTETMAPVGYTQIHPITVTVKFNAFGNIAEMTDDSFRAEEGLASNTGRSHHMIVIIGNGTVNEAYTVKIVTEDSQSNRRINGSIFQVEAIETDTGATNKSVTGATTNISSTLAGNTFVFERGALKVNGITAEGDVQIKFRQIESAVGYVYGANPTSGIVNIHTEFEIIPSTQEKQVTITEGNGNDERFDIQIDNVNRVITIKVLNDPQVDFEITKVDRDTKEPIEGMKFNITSTVIENGQSVDTGFNKAFSPTDDKGYTASDVGYSYDAKTVIYTISEEKDLQYRQLEPIVISVQYDTSGNIASYQILSNPNDVTIKEDDTKTISKRVLSDSSPIIGIVDINYSNITIPTGIGSRILQLEINNSKEPKDYRIQIGKYHEDTTYPYLLPGAKYEITVAQEHGKASTTWVDITDENGIILSPYFNGYGDIEISIKELEAPEGFELDNVTKTTRIKRYESSGNIVIHSTDVGARVSQDNTTIYLDVVDKQLAGIYDIIVNKVDSKTGNLIEQNPADIKLQLVEEIETITQTIDPETGEVVENVTTAEVTTPIFEESTDEYGRIIAKNLNAPSKPGVYKYILSETKAPKDYIGISENQVEILVTFDLNENQEMIITNVVVKDAVDVKAGKASKQIMNIIVYNTLDEEGSSTLADDEFGIDLRKVDTDLYQITGSTAKFKITDMVTNEVIDVETDELGRAQLIKFKIPETEGQYQLLLSEVQAPRGYKPLEGDINILLDFAKDENGKIYLARANVVGQNVVYSNKAEDGELPNRKLELKVINEDGPYTLVIEKHHTADPYYPDFIPGVTFDIKVTPEFGGEVLETTKTTNDEGIITIEDLQGYGRIKVEITEKSAPDAYKVDYETKVLEFYRDKYTKELREYDSNVNYELDEENQIVYMKPSNEIKAGIYDLVINKVDKNTNKTITNNPTIFNLNMIKKHYKNNIVIDPITGEETNVPEITEIKIPIIEAEATSAKGYLTKNFIEMPKEAGIYTFELEEVKAPSGYEKLKDPIRYDVTLELNDKNELIITNVEVQNEDINLQVLTWKDQFISLALLNQNGIPDGKVQFQVTKVDEEKNPITTDTAVFKITDRKTNEVYYMETDINSSIANKLIEMPKEAGKYNYTINEIKAPEGYALDRNDINLELEYTEDSNEEGKIVLSKVTVNGQNVVYTNEAKDDELPNRNIELEVTNKLGQNSSVNEKTYTVIVNKIDEITKERILDRATFDVALANGEIVHASTNEEGQMIIENVHMPATPGDYEVIIKETKAPEGYILDEEMKIVNVTFSGLAQNMIISNLALGEANNTNIEIVTAECTEDKIVLNVLNKAEDDPLYVVSRKYDDGEVIYDVLEGFTGSDYSIDTPFIDTKVARYMKDTTVEQFIGNLESNGVMTVLDKNGNELSPTSRVKTGMTLRAVKGDEELTFTIIIKGDSSKDGRLTATDLHQFEDHVSGKKPITDPIKLRALDLVKNYGDGKIRATDLNEMYKLISAGELPD